MAAWRETKTLKPTDDTVIWAVASFQAVAQANAEVASSSLTPEAESFTPRRRQHGRVKLAETPEHSGGVLATAWKQGHTKQLEKPYSLWGEIPRADHLYNQRPWEMR